MKWLNVFGRVEKIEEVSQELTKYVILHIILRKNSRVLHLKIENKQLTRKQVYAIKQITLLYEMNGDGNSIIIRDSDDVVGPSNIIPFEQSIHEGSLMTKSNVQVVKQENQA